MAKKGDYQIPFSKQDGEVLSYAYSYGGSGIEWKNNFEFDDVLEFHDFERGRSAAHARFVSLKDKRTYPMFLTDLKAVMPHLVDGKLSGKFTFCKRGTNYGVAMVIEKVKNQKENANAMQ